jgi:hypothetical protein
VNFRVRATAVGVICVALLAATPAPAFAGKLPTPKFGPGIDPLPGYQGQTTCSSHVQPGVKAFRRIVMRAFPTTGKGYFLRSCSAGARSEHKDGRAWDWMVSAYSPSESAKVDKLLAWLFAKDEHGNRIARARRLGVMYLIWNRRIWLPSSGWKSYSGSNPHTNHVHFSFTWPGALKETTYWHRNRSFVTGAAGNPDEPGFWITTGNANVIVAGDSDFHGDESGSVGKGTAVAIAPTSSGNGYWLVKANGRVLTYGDAKDKGSMTGPGTVSDMVASSRGYGYWIVTKSGRVEAFGNADHFGNEESNSQIMGMERTPSGNGYWLVSKRGRVFEFGNAQELGGLKDSPARIVDITGTPEQGYWLVTHGGRVWPFGSAKRYGDVHNEDLEIPIVSIVGTPSGNGYWLIDANAKKKKFGDATNLATRHVSAGATATGAEPPADPAPDEGLLFEDFLRQR